jgi:hypothetical protein
MKLLSEPGFENKSQAAAATFWDVNGEEGFIPIVSAHESRIISNSRPECLYLYIILFQDKRLNHALYALNVTLITQILESFVLNAEVYVVDLCIILSYKFHIAQQMWKGVFL